MNSGKILITDIQRFSLNDGPGIRTTVFLKGCPWRCPWCHNPETQSPEPELMFFKNLCLGCESCARVCENGSLRFIGEAGTRERIYDRSRCTLCGACASACPTDALKMAGRELGADELLAVARQDRDYFEQSGGGITFSGGEPLMQASRLSGIISAVHADGFHTAVDTAGCYDFDRFEQLISQTDLFLFDIKTMDADRHKDVIGESNRLALANLRRLAIAGKSIIIRVPVIPGFNDTGKDIAAIAKFAASLGIGRMDLLPFHPYAESKYAALDRTYAACGLAVPGSGQMVRLFEAASAFIADVRIEQH